MILGGKGDDWIYGGAVNNRLVGNGGNDYLVGGGGRDALSGGAADFLYRGLGTDKARGDNAETALGVETFLA